MRERKCAVCQAPITGRRDRKTCSDRCRTALNRAESPSEAVTDEPEPVTTADGSVTAWHSDEPADPLDHWQPIEEEGLPWP